MCRFAVMACCLVCAAGPASAQSIVPINVFAAYLHVDPADLTVPATPVLLSSLGLYPGYTVRIEPVGDWDAGPGGDSQTNLLAVFSGSATLLGPSAPNRVPGAVDAGQYNFTGGTWPGNEPTDIAYDFLATPSATVVIPAGVTHLFVTVADIYYRDNSDPDGDFGAKITVIATTDVPGAAGVLGPRELRAYPNPFRFGTAIEFQLKVAASARLTIQDVAGRRLRVLDAGTLPAGRHSVRWDGCDSFGRRVAPGTYFAVFGNGVRSETVRVNLLR